MKDEDAMNRFDRMLDRAPASDNSWHCPWFKLIMLFAINGAGFGLYAYLAYDVWLGLVAVAFSLMSSSFALGSRSRKASSC